MHVCIVLQLFSYILIQFLSLKTTPTNSVELRGATTDYRILDTSKTCFSKLEEPQCTFWISNSASSDLKTECMNITNLKSIPVMRIQGEFHILRIRCTATYPIDFLYYGIQPTEAMFIEWSKEIIPNTDLVQNQNYTVEVKVYSVQALFDYYNDPANSFYQDPSEFLPLKVKHDYSRTGNYSFPGILNKTLGTSFYLFLEDSAQPSFLRNSHTKSVSTLNGDPFTIIIPCISSHKDIHIEGQGPLGPLDPDQWNPIDGFVVKPSGSLFGNYSCTLKVGDVVVDTIHFNFQGEGLTEQIFGIENIDAKSGEGIEVTGEVPATLTNYVEFIHPICKTKDPDVPVDSSAFKLISVPSPNFGHMRLVQQFALPKFVNRSYTAITVQHGWDPLTRAIKQTNGVNQRMGTVYCSTGYGEKIVDFGSGIRVEAIIPFNYGLDWTKFNRRTSNIKVHFGIRPLNKGGPLYIDSEVAFECRVNVPVLVKPVVWFIETKNGTVIQERIDYNLDYDTSIQNFKIHPDLKSISCASSYWYSDFWRNITYEIGPASKNATKPTIQGLESEFKFDLNSVNRNIRCTAGGEPTPEIYFEKDGKRVQAEIQNFNSTILIFPIVDKLHAGTYFCIANNNLYITKKDFIVEVVDENSSFGVILLISIAILVFFITALGAYLYVKFFRAEKTGLTKQEVEDFMKGLNQGEPKSVPDGNDYTHEFAIMRPYVKDFEVHSSRFQIDESKVLGKGAFGLVVQGTVDNTIVAVKTVQRNADKQYLKALLSELKIMIHLGHHENVVPIVGAYTKDLRRGYVYVFVKYLPLGNLQCYLRKNQAQFQAPQKQSLSDGSVPLQQIHYKTLGLMDMINWSKQIASGMEYLGSKNVIHGDLASRNVLLDQNKVALVTDFGLSRQLYDYNDYVKKNQEPLPWRWMALESLRFMAFSKQSDVWSFGVTMWEIFSLGEIPYPGYSWTLDFVTDLENGLRMSRPKHGTAELFALMYECWHPEPVKRPLFSALRSRLEQISELNLSEVEELESTQANVPIPEADEYQNTNDV